jgi:hypothetical protein
MARVVDEELVYVLFCDMVINNNVIIFFYNWGVVNFMICTETVLSNSVWITKTKTTTNLKD